MLEEKIDLKELKKLLSPLSLLYVEDNLPLQEKAASFFEKLFGSIFKANNGEEGLALFKEHRPHLVITDIQMPLMNGLEMAQALREIDPNVKIIITSAYDEKEYLLKTISLGLDGYLIKPLKVEELSSTLFHLASKMAEERSKNLFHNYLYSIFNNQNNLIVMLKNETVMLANDHALHFFNAPSLKEFKEGFKLFDTWVQPHDTFLYHREDDPFTLLERVKKGIDKLYNIKIADASGDPHHFILKLTHISEQENLYILSLTDITELNLLALYDKNALEHDKAMKDQKTIYSLLRAAKEAGAVIKVYNYYKGLVICNNAVLSQVTKEGSVLKTALNQLRSIRHEQKIVLNCELFPYDLYSNTIVDINFYAQSVEIGRCEMLKTTPSERKSLILEPHPKHKLSLFYNQRLFETKTHIINISLEALKMGMEYLPSGMKEGDDVVLDMVFSDGAKPIIVNTKATIYRIITLDKNFQVVAKFQLSSPQTKIIIDYLSSRQMQLIREFKGLSL